jgi:hypothetical protein
MIRSIPNRLILSTAICTFAAASAQAGLVVTNLGKTYTRNTAVTPNYLFQAASDTGGSTSVRNEDRDSLDWKEEGYYQRNRDLGQIFNIPAGVAFTLDSIVLRTGNSASAVLSGAANAGVYLQIFRVDGVPTINDNGTPVGTNSAHGFTTNHRADDFVEGVNYTNLALATGGTFPNIPATTTNGGQTGHLTYLRWDLTGGDEITLDGGSSGTRYAFIVGFTDTAPDRGFTLGNQNFASDPAAPAFRLDPNNRAIWAIRREGDGTLPPTQIPGVNPPSDLAVRTALQDESLFAPNHQLTLSPTADGYPDVDTYRVLTFYIETKPVPEPTTAALLGMCGMALLTRRSRRS